MISMRVMKTLRSTVVALLIVAAACVGGVAASAPDKAEAADAVPVLTCDSLVIHLGETLHCVVSNTAGLTPAVSIIWINPRTRSQMNIANLAGQTYVLDFTPSLGDVGRHEIARATIYYPASGHLVRASTGYAYFDILAALPIAA